MCLLLLIHIGLKYTMYVVVCQNILDKSPASIYVCNFLYGTDISSLSNARMSVFVKTKAVGNMRRSRGVCSVGASPPTPVIFFVPVCSIIL